MSVTKDSIVNTCLEILNRDGIEGLTMRAIANALGIKAASLYWHYNSKMALYSDIAEFLCSALKIPINSDAKERLLSLCGSYRAMLLATRDSVVIMEQSIPSTPYRIELIKAQYTCLLEMGVDEKHHATAAMLVNNYVLSFVADEIRLSSRDPEQMEQFAQSLSYDERTMFFNAMDYDEQFLYGLNVIITGLERSSEKT